MDSRAPRANRGAGVERQGCYRPDAVSVRPKGHVRVTRSASRVEVSLGLRRVRQCAGHILVPNRPNESAEFVRHGNRGFVVAAPRVHRHRPVVQTREGLLGRPAPVGRREHRARAVGEQAPEIGLTEAIEHLSRR